MGATRFLGLVAAFGVAATGFAGSAFAQGSPVYYSGSAAGQGNCPGISWRLVTQGGNTHGYAWFTDASGLSRVAGLVQPQGALELTMTSLQGNGPTGTAVGTRSPSGALNAVLKGPGCSNVTISHPKPDIEGGDQK